jgi:two-component system KDP operon response regulator KdpE
LLGLCPRGEKESSVAGNSKVLIIDDDQDFRASVRALLESRGYAVVEAESGTEGLNRLVQEKPGLIVLDIMMKCCCEGYGVTHALRHKEEYADYRKVPIVMTSSIEQPPEERFAMAGEAEMIRPDYYLTKPLDIPLFLETVERAMAAASVA